jgi:hypothetical protein
LADVGVHEKPADGTRAAAAEPNVMRRGNKSTACMGVSPTDPTAKIK